MNVMLPTLEGSHKPNYLDSEHWGAWDAPQSGVPLQEPVPNLKGEDLALVT